MKKIFKSYLIVWAVLLVLFNVIAFVSVGWAGVEKYTPSFWIGYVFITAALIGNLICAGIALNRKDAKVTFYGLPLVTVSYAGLIVSFIVGGLCMLISPLPYYVGVIVCAVVLAVYVIAVVMADAAASLVAETDGKVKGQTLFVKSLTMDAEGLLSRAGTEEARAACKKVFEAVRYSDPMSNDALAGIESQITLKFSEFSAAVTGGSENVGKLADELAVLIGDRNKKCKLLK